MSLAACASGGDALPAATDAPPTDSAPIADSTLDDALIYITPEGLLAGANLAQIDLSSLVLDGGGDTTPINLGDLDASEVSIVTNSEGNQVFAVSRVAAIGRASSDTFSSPVSYNLAASREISFIDKSGDSKTIEAHVVIAADALTADPGVISVIKALADVEGTSGQLAAITVDLSEVFLSTSKISFSAFDDKGNTFTLSDKNEDGVVAEFSLGELAASFGESGTITVRALIAGNISAEQRFTVEVAQEKVNTPFVGDGSVVSITDGSANSASVVLLPLSGGDGEITYALEGANKDAGVANISQGRLFFRADTSGTYTLVATDIDGDEALITIEYSIPDSEISIAKALTAQTYEGSDGDVTVSLAEVFDGGDGDLTLTSGNRTIANNILTIDTEKLVDGGNTITVTAKDSDGDIAIATFVLTVDKAPTVDAGIANIPVFGNSNHTTMIDLSAAFGFAGTDTLSYIATDKDGSTDDLVVSGNMLDVSSFALTGGSNTITIVASDTDSNTDDSDKATVTFVITTNKSPTIAASISDEMRATNDSNTTIDLTTVFANGSGTLTYALTASKGKGGGSVSLKVL
ncbi:MAG: hypothetical protein K0U78_05930 [Actinomycetia bacterium]|nr:hypothetical protein [Actinomycetes bacterium]